MDNTTTVALSRLVAQAAGDRHHRGQPGERRHAGLPRRAHGVQRLAVRQHGGRPPAATRSSIRQDRASYRDRQAGQMTHTGNPLDLAIGGDGYFTVQAASGPAADPGRPFALETDGSVVDEQGNALLDATGKTIKLAPPTPTSASPATAPIVQPERTDRPHRRRFRRDPDQLQAEGTRLLNAGGTTTARSPPRICPGRASRRATSSRRRKSPA